MTVRQRNTGVCQLRFRFELSPQLRKFKGHKPDISFADTQNIRDFRNLKTILEHPNQILLIRGQAVAKLLHIQLPVQCIHTVRASVCNSIVEAAVSPVIDGE